MPGGACVLCLAWLLADAGTAEIPRDETVAEDAARPERLTGASPVERAAPTGTRPLLMGEDPVQRMRDLIKEREPFYNKADAKVETDRKAPQQVAAEVVRLARQGAGW